jgi:hypothetical protein
VAITGLVKVCIGFLRLIRILKEYHPLKRKIFIKASSRLRPAAAFWYSID